MKLARIYFAAAAAVVLIPLVQFLRTFAASPLPKPEPYAGPLPSASPPKNLTVFAVAAKKRHPL
jgi:hypothetical protein